MDRILASAVLVASVVALLLIYYLPRKLVPSTHSSRQDDLIKTVASRNEIRKTYAQLFAGASFVVTFLLSIYNFNRDFAQKARQAAAEQFIKTSEAIRGKDDEAEWSHVNAFEIMAMTAREDGSFNAAVYGTMGQFILKASMRACKPADGKDDTDPSYAMPPELQRIAQIFGGNNVPDPWGGKTNMSGACLSRAQLRQANGLQQLFLKDARLIGTEFVGSNLRASVLDKAQGGINLVTKWWDKNHDQVEARGYDAVAQISYDSGSYAWVNFQDANLESVSAINANFKGAIFYSASMKDSNWSDADLSFSDLNDANLKNADLQRTVFESASLQGVNLENARLIDAKLAGANLTGSFFANTNVTGADFQRTNLASEQIRGMCVQVGGRKPQLPSNLASVDIAECPQGGLARTFAFLRAAFAQSRWTD